MLTIRPDQLSLLAGGPAERYVAQAVEFVRTKFPVEFARRGPDGVRSLVRRAMADAPAYGFESGHEVTGLVTLMILLRDDFVTDPFYAWARAILLAKAVPPGEKVGLILDELINT
jgi:hypothetical protein